MHYDVHNTVCGRAQRPRPCPAWSNGCAKTPLGGKLLACWFSELGALNQILLDPRVR